MEIMLKGRKTRAAVLCCLGGKAERGMQDYQICQHEWRGEGREMLLYTPSWGWLGEGEEKQRENKTWVFDREPARLLSKWKCSPLLMEVYLLAIVSRASPLKGSFDGSVFVHPL